MDTIRNLALLVLVAMLWSAPGASGSTAEAPAPPLDWMAMIAVAVPALLAILKLLVPAVPPALIPFLAPVLGMVIDIVSAWFAGNPPSPLVGATWGMVGVGLREIIDQTKKIGSR